MTEVSNVIGPNVEVVQKKAIPISIKSLLKVLDMAKQADTYVPDDIIEGLNQYGYEYNPYTRKVTTPEELGFAQEAKMAIEQRKNMSFEQKKELLSKVLNENNYFYVTPSEEEFRIAYGKLIHYRGHSSFIKEAKKNNFSKETLFVDTVIFTKEEAILLSGLTKKTAKSHCTDMSKTEAFKRNSIEEANKKLQVEFNNYLKIFIGHFYLTGSRNGAYERNFIVRRDVNGTPIGIETNVKFGWCG